MVKCEEHYYADPPNETVLAIHVSLRGLEALYYCLDPNDQFAKDLWYWLERLRPVEEEAEF